MIARTGFPEYIESIAIGPDIEFLKTNTSLCDVAEEFNIELQLAYKWRGVTTSSSVLPELRNYIKYLTANGPELDTETLIYFKEKINRLPSRYRYIVLDELDKAFNKADKFRPITTPVTDFSTDKIDDDRDFLGKLADLLKNCNSPCNYFKAYGDSIGTIFDISRNNNTSTEPSSVDGSKPPATHIGMNIFNKLHTSIRDSYAEMCARMGAAWDEIKTDKPSIVKSDTDAYSSIANVYSDALSKVKRRTQDCFRLYDYNNRYNAYNSQMNLGVARNKYFDLALKISDLEKKVFSVNSSGDIKNHDKPLTSAVEALSILNIKTTTHDDLVFKPRSVTAVLTNTTGASAKIGSNEIHFTTYGLYDANTGTGDSSSDQGLGGNVPTPAGEKGEYKVDLKVQYFDIDGYLITPVALSDEAKSKYGFKELGETFILRDPNGAVHTFMYADRSPQRGINFDIADYTSTTGTAAEAASPARFFRNGSDRNANELIITKSGVVSNLAIRKYIPPPPKK